jgi:hypothetical protein
MSIRESSTVTSTVLRTLVGGWQADFQAAVALIRPARTGHDQRLPRSRRAVVFPRLLIDPSEVRLSVNGRIDQVKPADHRLLLAARRRREQRDERTFAHTIQRTTHPVSDDFSWPDAAPDGFSSELLNCARPSKGCATGPS